MKKAAEKIITVGLCAVIMAAAGCNRPADLQKETQTQREVMEEAQKIDNSIDKNYNDGLVWNELPHKFPHKGGGDSISRKSYNYGRRIIYTGDLITDENVKSIEYSLSNCVGSFMDESYYKNKEVPIRKMILDLENKPYLLEGNDQSEVYFVVYYYYYDPTKIDYKSQAAQVQECMKYLRITTDITFEDGTKETRKYGIRFTSDTYYDEKHMSVYRLE